MAYNFLIIDDSKIVRKVLIKALGMTELEIKEIFEAENGKEGLDTLYNKKIDLIFLDINMPIMNGMEFMEKFRADKSLKPIPVIVISTEGSKERKQELFDKDIKAYLRKPVTPELLTETITNVLQEV